MICPDGSDVKLKMPSTVGERWLQYLLEDYIYMYIPTFLRLRGRFGVKAIPHGARLNHSAHLRYAPEKGRGHGHNVPHSLGLDSPPPNNRIKFSTQGKLFDNCDISLDRQHVLVSLTKHFPAALS